MRVSSPFLKKTVYTLAALVVFPTALHLFRIIDQAEGKIGSGSELQTIPITLGNKTIHAVVADTDDSRIKGLLGWEQISEGLGMLLDFRTEGKYAIHMQGMKFPIDAVWIDGRGEIKLIYESIVPNSGLIYPSMFPCRYCLEIKAGFCKKHGVKIGQSVQFGAPAVR